MTRTSIRFSHWIEDVTAAFQKNKTTALVAAFFFIGMLYGSLLVGFGEKELLESLNFMTKGYLTGRVEQSFWQTFLNSLLSSGALLLLLFLFGFSGLSVPIVLFLPAFKGMGLGVSIGYLYTTYGWKGVAFCAVMLLPATIFSALAIILAARESLRLSILFLSTFIPRIRGTLSPKTVKQYCIKYGILLGVVLLSALIDSVTSFLFADFVVL